LPSLGAAAAAPEPFLPGAASPWSPGDDPAAIDWPATLAAGPDLGAAAPRRRELEPDEDPAPSPTRRGRGEAPRVEIYLDTSWSMPHPEEGLNAMTLAALILATAATRQGGQVRAILFSENYMVSDWLGDEKAALDFLCGTYLGGTVFPFELLAEHAREEPGIVRVILSDGDFFWTYPSHKDSFAAAVAASDPLVATLLGCDPANVRAQFATLLSTGHFGFVPVAGAGDFAGVSASLARVLFRRRR
ncbi:MAG: hypothetical protein FJZ01_28825, partial [Candidatus Sericytochromatia bacterium]|nr:hypothetical protein [Candidatus Tanganyikabacteria bacterium]